MYLVMQENSLRRFLNKQTINTACVRFTDNFELFQGCRGPVPAPRHSQSTDLPVQSPSASVRLNDNGSHRQSLQDQADTQRADTSHAGNTA